MFFFFHANSIKGFRHKNTFAKLRIRMRISALISPVFKKQNPFQYNRFQSINVNETSVFVARKTFDSKNSGNRGIWYSRVRVSVIQQILHMCHRETPCQTMETNNLLKNDRGFTFTSQIILAPDCFVGPTGIQREYCPPYLKDKD